MIKKLIIGIVGTAGSGKDTLAEYLQKKGFIYTSLSDRIREECDRLNLSRDRDNLIRVANGK